MDTKVLTKVPGVKVECMSNLIGRAHLPLLGGPIARRVGEDARHPGGARGGRPPASGVHLVSLHQRRARAQKL